VHRIFNSPGFWLTIFISFVFGMILMISSVWLSPIADAETAMQNNDLQTGLSDYSRAEARFDNFSFTKQLFPEEYVQSVANQFYILYELGRYDEMLEKAASSPVFADVHFWTGCALFRRAGSETDVQAQISWLERASGEFFSALKLEPDNWDVKYNYELTERLISELKDEDESPPQVLELLRPRPRQGEEPSRKSG
jgi:tetratricopeptide (TPR) repeat protein